MALEIKEYDGFKPKKSTAKTGKVDKKVKDKPSK